MGPIRGPPKPSGDCQRTHGNLLQQEKEMKLIHATTRMNLEKTGSSHRKNLWEVKEASYKKRSHTISFYLYKLSRMGKSRGRK